MTAKPGFTKTGLKRAIAAARESGLFVVGVRPDGILLLDIDPPVRSLDGRPLLPVSDWEDDKSEPALPQHRTRRRVRQAVR
jgi:hypothetical protein